MGLRLGVGVGLGMGLERCPPHRCIGACAAVYESVTYHFMSRLVRCRCRVGVGVRIRVRVKVGVGVRVRVRGRGRVREAFMSRHAMLPVPSHSPCRGSVAFWIVMISVRGSRHLPG